ncbi:glucan 1,3-beta-glucosidase [Geosmithia morbida]|uniref:glucan 1,3-beta-glucosidase n=1 Tax=Geosmithia morbida TaxID=1094350 RepID=A0A9P5D419_9HYPO|nr:glucan 1,3-beta-glucosidase [Geosmithia morbida]KAF4125582.1 glucan 1,3-beta-glucosidase [Geosmithia morbida]
MAHGHSSSRPAASRARNSRREASRRKDERRRRKSRPKTTTSSSEENGSGSGSLSSDALAQLERENARRKREEARKNRKAERTKKATKGSDYREVAQEATPIKGRQRDREAREATRRAKPAKGRDNGKGKRRVVSGAMMEEGRIKPGGGGLRGGGGKEWRWSDQSYEKPDHHYQKPSEKKRKKKKKKLWIILGCSLVILIIIIVVAVVVSKKKKKSEDSDSSLDDSARSEIPKKWRNTYLDPWTWKTTTDFNTTFTDEMVGDLPVMGLMSEWDDSARANDKVPALNEAWGNYSTKPARGMNLGGWLSPEPFITPSIFPEGVVDEWGLCTKLGSSKCASTLEEHYASFVTEDDFRQIAELGMDHVRIPFSYWAVAVYDGDPYVFRTSWRYLLRGIEWARQHGLRVNLDLHALPGSQNGYNHSGRKGAINWLNGTDGDTNADRSIDVHDRLSRFFAQDRYRNIITHYGLANEPRMVELEADKVVAWTEKAYGLVKGNGIGGLVVFGDGFMGLENWQGLMTGYDDLVLDVHQYVVFNDDLISFTHKRKIQYACSGWTQQTELSLDPSQGYGPSLFAEWSQADTDCEPRLNGGEAGSRWDGTLASDSGGPQCPSADSSCSCDEALADPDSFSDSYKKFLLMFAEAQMHSFEIGWGWWYWTWKTESAPLWSWKAGAAAGILPKKAYERDFDCDSDIPDFGDEGL